MFDIKHLTDGKRLAVDYSVSLDIPKAYGVLEKSVNVNVTGTITKLDKVYAVKCACEAALTAECALCLKPVDIKLSFEVDEIFSEDSADFPPESEEEQDVWPVIDKIIDLKPVIESYLLSIIPVKQMCGESCMGLCYKCGKNLNEGPCGCNAADTPEF